MPCVRCMDLNLSINIKTPSSLKSLMTVADAMVAGATLSIVESNDPHPEANSP